MLSANLTAPIIGTARRTVGIAGAISQVGNWHHPANEIGVLVVFEFLRPDRRQAGNKDKFVLRRKLHHFARREQRAGRLLLGYHDVAQPWGETVAGIIALRPQFRGGAERVGYALGRAFVVGGKRDPDMAVVQDGVVLTIGLGNL